MTNEQILSLYITLENPTMAMKVQVQVQLSEIVEAVWEAVQFKIERKHSQLWEEYEKQQGDGK